MGMTGDRPMCPFIATATQSADETPPSCLTMAQGDPMTPQRSVHSPQPSALNGLRRQLAVLAALAVTLPAGMVSAQRVAQANFESTSLSAGFSAAAGTLRGRTGGQVSLPGVVANRDRAGNLCLGFGSTMPDHIVTLEEGFAQLTLRVNSNGNDTSLIVRGPSGVHCGSNVSRTHLDQQVIGTDWEVGTYEVWVGSSRPGQQFGYTITIQE